MNTFSCIIVDDEPDAIELLEASLTALYKNVNILGTYTQWTEALKMLKESDVDVLFLDISMPGKSGLDFLKLLPNLQSEVIFITAYENHALSAFQISAAGYILKPIDDAMLATAIDNALERIKYKRLAQQPSQKSSPKILKIGIPNNKDINYIDINTIIYMETNNKCTNIITTDNTWVSSYNIGKFKQILENNAYIQFYQVHRSFIINMDFVLRYNSSGHVTMKNNKEIPISKNIKADFLKHFPNPEA